MLAFDPVSDPSDAISYENDIATASASASSTSNLNPYRARVEEVPDEDDLTQWVQKYPRPVATILGSGECTFEKWRRENEEAGQSRWFPFSNAKEWELGRWLVKNAGQNQIKEFLKLTLVSHTYRYRMLRKLMAGCHRQDSRAQTQRDKQVHVQSTRGSATEQNRVDIRSTHRNWRSSWRRWEGDDRSIGPVEARSSGLHP